MCLRPGQKFLVLFGSGVPCGIRTRVTNVKEWIGCPPLSTPVYSNILKTNRKRHSCSRLPKRVQPHILDKIWTKNLAAEMRTVRDAKLETRTARLELKQRGKPYGRPPLGHSGPGVERGTIAM